MIAGYARPTQPGEDITPQVRALEKAGCDRIWSDAPPFMGRKEMAACLSSLQKGDTLVTTEPVVLAFSLPHFVRLVTGLREDGITYRSLDGSVNTRTKRDAALLAALDGVRLAHDRDIAGGKPAGGKTGRPASTTADEDAEILRLGHLGTPVTEIARTTGVGRNAIYRVRRMEPAPK